MRSPALRRDGIRAALPKGRDRRRRPRPDRVADGWSEQLADVSSRRSDDLALSDRRRQLHRRDAV